MTVISDKNTQFQKAQVRNKLTMLISECYSTEGSTCKLHPVFQPQKYLNKLLFEYKVELIGR